MRHIACIFKEICFAEAPEPELDETKDITIWGRAAVEGGEAYQLLVPDELLLKLSRENLIFQHERRWTWH